MPFHSYKPFLLQLRYTVTIKHATRPSDRPGWQALVWKVDYTEQVRIAPPPLWIACLSFGRSLTDATSKVGPYNDDLV